MMAVKPPKREAASDLAGPNATLQSSASHVVTAASGLQSDLGSAYPLGICAFPCSPVGRRV